MHVPAILPFILALTSSVLGQQVTKGAIGDQFNKISASMSTFASALAAVEDTSGIGPAMAASNQVLGTIQNATSVVAGLSGQLSLVDAAELAAPSETLADAAVKLVKDLEARSGVINSVGLTDEVLNQLKTQLAATKAFVNAVKTKVPPELAEIAQEAAKTALDAVQGAIDFFSKPVAPVG
jgi:Hydrophobic surface binding protein A